MTDFNQKTHDTDVGSHGGQSRQMMEVFENQEFGSIRVLQEAGKTFFCASDVAKALGYVNPYAAVKRHCRGPLTKREGVVQKVNQYGDAGEQVVEISFITEGDVYRLIVHSKLPSAERFEHWVFDEVLPSIRKHGVYMSDSILDQVIQHPEVIYTLAQELVAEREQLEGIRKQLDAAQPKADYFDTFVNSEDCTCIRNFCKEIGIPEKTAVGKHGIVDFDDGLIASSLVIIRCNRDKILPLFLLAALETDAIEKQLQEANNGSSQPNLSAASVT